MRVYKSWSPVEIDRLITSVRERRELYDHNSPGYANLNIADTLWGEISSRFPNRSEQELRRKWQILRTGYRCRKDKKYLSSETERTTKKWPYFDSLLFLEPYVASRKTSTNVPADLSTPSCSGAASSSSEEINTYIVNDDGILISDDDVKDEEQYDPPIHQVEMEDVPLSTVRIINQHEMPPYKKLKLTSVDEHFIEYLRKKQKTPKKAKSSNELFFASLLEDMNKLTPTNLRKFKISILNNLNELLR